MNRTNRRALLLSAAAITLPSAGCRNETVSDAVEVAVDDIDTATLEQSMVALKGFEIVAWEVGKRVIFLPVPAVRIIAVTLIISAGAAKVAIEYLDIELKRRSTEETITEEQVVELESNQAVKFKLENGYTEDVPLGPTKYSD